MGKKLAKKKEIRKKKKADVRQPFALHTVFLFGKIKFNVIWITFYHSEEALHCYLFSSLQNIYTNHFVKYYLTNTVFLTLYPFVKNICS